MSRLVWIDNGEDVEGRVIAYSISRGGAEARRDFSAVKTLVTN
jgi:hypothetical protein